jgi:Uma2 family endonuclease
MRRMTLDEFLRWEDGSDTRYELIDGVPVAMPLPAAAHRILWVRLCSAIDAALRERRPCAAQIGAAIARPDRADTCYIADLAVTCRAHARGEQLVADPILLVEILSPGTERHDRQVKVPAYRQIDSVEEILLIDSESLYAETLRRDGERWITDLVRGADGQVSSPRSGCASTWPRFTRGWTSPPTDLSRSPRAGHRV